MVKIAKSAILQTFDGDFSSLFNDLSPGISAVVHKQAQVAKVKPDKTPESTVGTLKNLRKRARSKWYTNKIIAPLLYLDSPLHGQYQRAYLCSCTLVRKNNKVTSKYCNSRICHICNRMRKSMLMDKYGVQLKELGDLCFVTLTVPNCRFEDLRATGKRLLKEWAKVLDVLKKRKLAPNGFRKYEITYNAEEDTFHPHLHIMIDKGLGDIVIEEWLKRFPEAVRKAQHTRLADKGAYHEVFKYTSKIVTATKGKVKVYVPAINQIMIAMDGIRCFQPFGKIKAVSEDVAPTESTDYLDLPTLPPDTLPDALVFYHHNGQDWYDDYGNALTGFTPLDIEFELIE